MLELLFAVCFAVDQAFQFFDLPFELLAPLALLSNLAFHMPVHLIALSFGDSAAAGLGTAHFWYGVATE